MKVNFFAPINDLGYGIHSYNTIKEFEARGHGVTLVTPFGRVSRGGDNINRWLDARNHFDPNLPGIMIFNEEYLTQFCGRPRIGFPVFECEQFTPLQVAMIKTCDAVFTPSKWGASVLHAHQIRNVHIVNEGFDPDLFPWMRVSKSEENDSPFTFVHVGKFEARKGTLQAIECFFTALEGEHARLIMHVHNPFLNDYAAIHELVSRLGFTTANNGATWRRAGLSIQFTQPVPDQKLISDLYLEADCGLFPTRAEGWGLPILECLASGVPCIVGSWTGQSEYVDAIAHDMDPFILKRPMRQDAADNIWFFGDRGKWNVPTDSEIVDRIRYAFANARTFRGTTRWQNTVAHMRKFTWARAAAQLEGSLLEVCGL